MIVSFWWRGKKQHLFQPIPWGLYQFNMKFSQRPLQIISHTSLYTTTAGSSHWLLSHTLCSNISTDIGTTKDTRLQANSSQPPWNCLHCASSLSMNNTPAFRPFEATCPGWPQPLPEKIQGLHGDFIVCSSQHLKTRSLSLHLCERVEAQPLLEPASKTTSGFHMDPLSHFWSFSSLILLTMQTTPSHTLSLLPHSLPLLKLNSGHNGLYSLFQSYISKYFTLLYRGHK